MATVKILHQNFLTDGVPVTSGTIFASGGAVGQSAATIAGPQPIKTGYATMSALGRITILSSACIASRFTSGAPGPLARRNGAGRMRGRSRPSSGMPRT